MEKRRKLSNDGVIAAAGVVLAVVVAGSALALGGAVPASFLPFAALALVAAGALLLLPQERSSLGLTPAVVLFALAAYSLVQALPLPLTWVSWLSPTAGDVWARCLAPLAGGVRYASLSLDRGATVFEAIKWSSYGATFVIAARVARRRGPLLGLSIVFGASTLLALVTLAHAVAGATLVYGVYTPRMAVVPGHVGPLLNPNNLAGYLNLGALVGMGMVLSRQLRFSRWALGVALATVVAVSLRTGSRGGIAALVVGATALAATALASKRRRFASVRLTGAVISGLLLVGAIFAVFGSDAHFWGSLLSENVDKLKLPLWTAPVVRDYPLFGVGRGAFESVFFAYRPATPGNIVYAYPENFVMQWVTEWGLPISMLAFAAFVWLFARARLGFGRSAVTTGSAFGVAILFLQNLVDLGLELPSTGVLVATTLGSLWGGAPLAPKHMNSQLTHRLLGLCTIGALLLIPWLLVLGPRTVADDRLRGRDLLTKVVRQPSAANRAQLAAEIVRQCLRHPADYYFPLLGAYQARLERRNAIPWLQRALERGPTVGRTHLLLGEILAERGLRAQGLMELRIAYEYEPSLAALIAESAIGQTKDAHELSRVVPEGSLGIEMLSQLAARLPDEKDRVARELLDEEALVRDPSLVEQRSRLVEARLLAIGSSTAAGCEDRAACIAEASKHIDAIDASAPSSTRGPRYRAQLLMAEGGSPQALEHLQSGCARPIERDLCLQLRIEILSKLAANAELQAALDAYPDAVCKNQKTCATAHAWVGRFRIGLGQRQQGVSSFERAARQDPTVERWLELADAAEAAGLLPTALSALEEAFRRGRTSEIEQRLARLRAR